MAGYRSDQIKTGNIYGWHVYIIKEDGNTGYCKIGSTSRVDYRLDGLRTGNPRKLILFRSWHLDSREIARNLETTALHLAGPKRLPKSEWLKCSSDEAAEIVERAILETGAVMRLNSEPQWSRT